MKIPATAYLIDSNRQAFIQANTDEERLAACIFQFSSFDMSSFWTKVGTCEVEVIWLPESNIREEEVKRVDNQIEKIQLEAERQITRLQEYRSTLLCLTHSPSPTES